MRKVRFLIVCLFVLCSLPLNAQPPKPRRATESKVIDPYLKWFSFTRTFGCTGLRVSEETILLAGINGPVLLPYPDPHLPIPDLSKIKSVKEVLQKEKIASYKLSPNFLRIFIRTDPSAQSYELWNPYRGQPKPIGTFTIGIFGPFSPPGSGEEMFINELPASKIVELRDTRTGKRIRSLTISDQSDNLNVGNVIFSPDGQRLAMTLNSSALSSIDSRVDSRDAMIELWNPHNGKRIRRITVPKQGKPFVSVNAPPVFSPDGRRFVVYIERSKPWRRDYDGTQEPSIEEYQKKLKQNTRNSIELWSSDGKRLATLELPENYGGATSLVFSPDGKIIAGVMTNLEGFSMQNIFLWNSRTGEHIRTLGTNTVISRFVFSPDGKIIAPSEGTDEIPLWNPHTGEVIKTLKHNVRYEDFKPGEISGPGATKKGVISDWKISHFAFGPGGRTAAAMAEMIPVFWEISPSTNNLAPPRGAQLPPKGQGRTVSPPISPTKPVPPKETDQLTKGRDKKVSTPTPPAEPLPPKGMVLIPAGEFQMGSNYLANKELKPVHTVYLDAFYIDTHEVTVGEYKQFLKATQGDAYRFPPSVTKYSPTDKHPIVGVSWHDAMAYAKWAGKRLPTEAEWEKAARGPEQFEHYPWEGKEIGDSQANYGGVWGEILPVGTFKPYSYGLYDMAGNVAEWCLDPFLNDFYENSPSPRKNPFAGFLKSRDETIANFESVKGKRVVRGGHWNSPETNVRVDIRQKAAVRTQEGKPQGYTSVGFRCAKDAR